MFSHKDDVEVAEEAALVWLNQQSDDDWATDGWAWLKQLTVIVLSFMHLNTKGTRIIYDRKFLLECRSSPATKTPPRGLPNIPGVTSPPSKDTIEKAQNGELLNNNNIIAAPDSSNTGMFTPRTNTTGWS